MDVYIVENGKMEKEMEKVHKYGQMAVSIKVIGLMIRHVVKGS